MENRSLDPLLNAYRSKTLPSVPGNLEQNVWRKIRLRSQIAPATPWQDFLDWILNGRLVGAALVTAIVIGFAFNVLLPQHVSAREAMGLGVFSGGGYSPLVEFAQNP